MKKPNKKFSFRDAIQKIKRSVKPGVIIPAKENVSAADLRKKLYNNASLILNDISVKQNTLSGKNELFENVQRASTVNRGQSKKEIRKIFVPDIKEEPTENKIIQSAAIADDIIKQNNEDKYKESDEREFFNASSNFNDNKGQWYDTDFNKSTSFEGESNNDLEEDLKNKSIMINSFAREGSRAFRSLWKELISGGKKAQDPWEALWLSFSKIALKSIGDIISSLLSNSFSGKASGRPGKDTFPAGLLSTIASLFIAGPAAAAIGASQSFMGKSSILNETMTYLYGSSDTHSIISAFNKYAEAAEKWQREIKVVNDVFENNRAIKTVQEYLAKIKS